MKTRDGRKMIHPNIFFYERTHPLAKRYVFEFLQELYRSKAIDEKKHLTSLIQKKLFDEIYEKNNGSIRPILKELSTCLINFARRRTNGQLPLLYLAILTTTATVATILVMRRLRRTGG